jgi:hypothetical protein
MARRLAEASGGARSAGQRSRKKGRRVMLSNINILVCRRRLLKLYGDK